MVGSIAFMASAVAPFVLPRTGAAVSLSWADGGTFIGAVCFFAGAWLTIPAFRPGRRWRSTAVTRERRAAQAPPPGSGNHVDYLVIVNYGCFMASVEIPDPQNPADGLAAVVALRRLADLLEAAQVERALRAGWSWSEVAEALDVTRQAVHKKYARRVAAAGIETRRRQWLDRASWTFARSSRRRATRRAPWAARA